MGSAVSSGSIKVPVRPLDQAGDRARAVGAVRLAAKTIKPEDLARRLDSEDRALVVNPAFIRCSIKFAIETLHQSGFRISTVRSGKIDDRSKLLLSRCRRRTCW